MKVGVAGEIEKEREREREREREERKEIFPADRIIIIHLAIWAKLSLL